MNIDLKQYIINNVIACEIISQKKIDFIAIDGNSFTIKYSGEDEREVLSDEFTRELIDSVDSKEIAAIVEEQRLQTIENKKLQITEVSKV